MSDMTAPLNKTPIGYLQEVCSEKGITPQYDLIATEGHVHEPTFVFRCLAGEYVATGKGPNKKTARHEAAQGVLQQMFSTTDAPEGVVKSGQIPPIPTVHEDGIMGNPVGQLQELTQKKKWIPPIYEFAQEQCHSRDFVCIVRLGKKFKETGIGKSKKAAKRKAAYSMLQRVKQGANINHDDMQPEGFEEDAMSLAVDGKGSCAKQEKKVSTSKKQGQLNLRMKVPNGKQLISVKNLSIDKANLDFVQILKTLGEEQKFEVSILDLPHIENDPYLCLIQLTTMPATVCHGEGATVEEANQNAGKKAVRFLKILLQK